MSKLVLENLPDEIMEQIRQLARQHNQSINDQAITLLQQALQKPQTPLKFIISPETDPTWAERRETTSEILADIEQRRKQRQTNIEWLDSTTLIREDRQR